MRIYLDNCCLNRPFDDQGQLRIRLEAEAKLDIQFRITQGEVQLAWSYILDYENAACPCDERRARIARWRMLAKVDVAESQGLLRKAVRFGRLGLRSKDALHLACAVAGGCDCFLTTDDTILDRAAHVREIAVMNPLDFVRKVTA